MHPKDWLIYYLAHQDLSITHIFLAINQHIKKKPTRWLWYAVDHATNTVLAYVFGKRITD